MKEIDNVRKVALVGTSCVGKTTLFENYQRKFKGNPSIAFVEEAARQYFTNNAHIPIAERFGLTPQGEIQDLAIQNEQLAHNSGAKIIICDRSVLDAVAYVRGSGDMNGADSLFERVEHWIPTYQTIFLLNPDDVPHIRDDVRLEDPFVRQRNHEAFLELFMLANIHYDLLTGTIEQRTKRIDELILF